MTGDSLLGRGKRKWLLAYCAVASALFLLLTFAVAQTPELPFDVPIEHAIQSFRNPGLDLFMQAIGLPGSPPQTLLFNALLVIIVFACKMIPEGITLLLFVPGYGTISTIFRLAINRARPSPDLFFVFDPSKDRGQSFPSGHTGNFIIVDGFLIFVGLTLLPPSWHRNLLLVLYALYMVLMPISRMYVAEHWPSDILGGILLGSVFLVLMILFYEWVRARFTRSASV